MAGNESNSRRRNKKSVLGGNIAVSGMNESALANAKSNADLMLSGNSTIELKISDDSTAVFELISIDSDKLDETTFVPEENGRDPKYVTEQSVEDLTDSMTKRGQIIPGIGYTNEDGMIAVLSGSRRRLGCKTLGIPFRIYVTKVIIEDSDAKYLADIANISKPLSLVEQGKKYAHLLATKAFKRGKDIAEHEGITPSMVSMAIKASELPANLIDIFPHVAQIGRPTVNKLRDIAENTPESQLQEAVSNVTKVTFSELCERAKSKNPYRLNAIVLELLEGELATKTQHSSAQTFTYPAVGGGKYHIKINEGETNYRFQGLSQAKLDEVEQAISKILGTDG